MTKGISMKSYDINKIYNGGECERCISLTSKHFPSSEAQPA